MLQQDAGADSGLYGFETAESCLDGFVTAGQENAGAISGLDVLKVAEPYLADAFPGRYKLEAAKPYLGTRSGGASNLSLQSLRAQLTSVCEETARTIQSVR